MRTRIRFCLPVIFLLAQALLLGACHSATPESPTASSTPNPLITNRPFSVEIIEARIIESTDIMPEEGVPTPPLNVKRLQLITSITSQTGHTFEKTKYAIQLNEEAKPFIADTIIVRDYCDPFRVVPENSKRIGEIEHGYMNVSGFEDRWEPLITAETDLREYYHLSMDSLPQHLQSVTVKISWEDGEQEECLPLNLP